ncbi:CocE/NonD family hydrolase [Mycobacterium malmoense]|uniref:Hydrolase n=1 Tax=Mycobacterium malmoense TaxID=1780 RepID=A0ABX3SLU4_MYCMA|nr:CocE/NonD family hydrolase [Mycobacterium malmoense]ORA78509.1 hydrolase [Mycobacterium malmoense]QZA18160.1 CocE/NonD family hydrolase [Mycobacterium malmoense]UNB94934.1 CocE/NonD family hydrolase [Mycobacterium malmoense]
MTSNEEAVFLPASGYDEAADPIVFGKFDPGTRVLPAGFQTTPQFHPLPVDIVFEKDTAVRLRDGSTIYVDVFRPVGTEKVPVIVAWSPYGKSGGTLPRNRNMFNVLGIDQSQLSGLGKFEGPDPAFWCAHGYAVCNPDARGVYHCEGDSVFPGEQDGRDCHDLIEWLAAADWCTGKVAMCGNSYLAISQWFTAAQRPPHLAAIAPWEGMSDLYRDLVMRGGMPDFGFPAMWATSYVGKNRREDLVAEAQRYPLMNDLWESKIARLERITVPAYVVASYSNLIHTPGTFRGWRQIGSPDKWLRIHNTMEWPDFNDEAHKRDLLRFFDHYLKGQDNGWVDTPRVRYSLLDLEGNDRVDVPAAEFPPDDVSYVKYYLDGRSQTLVDEAPASAAATSYDAVADRDGVSFVVRFDTETELVGYPKVRLWVESDGWDDMDLFVFLQKLDAGGRHLQQFNVPNHGEPIATLTRDGAAILKYKGSNGRLRVSMRHLDEATSTDAVPIHSFDRIEKLKPGMIVPVEIDMFPVGLAFHPGEQLRLVISGYNLLGGVMPNLSTGSPVPQNLATVVPDNHGRHIIHTGGSHASYLQLPVKPVS